MSSYRFVRGVAVRTRTVWPVRAKVMALSLYASEQTATAAIAAVASEFGIDLSDITSYTKNAGSHIGRFQREVARLLASGDAETIAACQEFGLQIEKAE